MRTAKFPSVRHSAGFDFRNMHSRSRQKSRAYGLKRDAILELRILMPYTSGMHISEIESRTVPYGWEFCRTHGKPRASNLELPVLVSRAPQAAQCIARFPLKIPSVRHSAVRTRFLAGNGLPCVRLYAVHKEICRLAGNENG